MTRTVPRDGPLLWMKRPEPGALYVTRWHGSRSRSARVPSVIRINMYEPASLAHSALRGELTTLGESPLVLNFVITSCGHHQRTPRWKPRVHRQRLSLPTTNSLGYTYPRRVVIVNEYLRSKKKSDIWRKIWWQTSRALWKNTSGVRNTKSTSNQIIYWNFTLDVYWFLPPIAHEVWCISFCIKTSSPANFNREV